MKWPDGSRYEGDWQAFERHGNGKMKFADGKLYEGTWYQDKM